MREFLRFGGFVLLFIGTVGLLSNELIFDSSREYTLAFAVLNTVGFAILAFNYWSMRRKT